MLIHKNSIACFNKVGVNPTLVLQWDESQSPVQLTEGETLEANLGFNPGRKRYREVIFFAHSIRVLNKLNVDHGLRLLL